MKKNKSIYIGVAVVRTEVENSAEARPFSSVEKAMEWGKEQKEEYLKEYYGDGADMKYIEETIAPNHIDCHDNFAYLNFFYSVEERVIDEPDA